MSDNQQDAGPDAARDARQQRLPLQWDPAVPGGPASSGRPAPSAQEPAADAPARESGAGNPVLPPDDISTGDEAVAAGGQTLLPGVAAESEVSATGPVPASVGDGGQPVARLDALPASLGQTLMEARGARNLSVAQVCQKTKIHRRFIEDVEADRVRQLPPAVYTRSYLTQLCQLYAIPVEPLLKEYARLAASAPAGRRRTQEGGVPDEAAPAASSAHATPSSVPSPFHPGLQGEIEPAHRLLTFSRLAVVGALVLLVAVVVVALVLMQVQNWRLAKSETRLPPDPAPPSSPVALEDFIIPQQLPLDELPVPEP
ncbi:MAG: hypothetical protein BWZ02_02892 [Lentisphaerae bacterium ADurb.BinA184]|nr:MAG: hypothetical protein BWZ02_02892 [Lentisphaerae bacterium ADurb.BinA184]